MTHVRPIIFGVLLSVVLGLAGCGKPDAGQDLLKSATARIDAGDLTGASLQLRSRLQADDRDPYARLLMGKVLMRQGAYEHAAVEFAKARELKIPDVVVVPLLAQAELRAGHFKKVVDNFGSLDFRDRDAAADLAVSVSTAHAMLGDIGAAEALLAGALHAAPGHVPAMVAMSRLKASTNRLADAQALIDNAGRLAPESEEVWRIRGDLLLHGRRDLEGAVRAYKQALTLDASSLRAHVSAISAMLLAQQVDAAEVQFVHMKKVFPSHVLTAYFEAQFAELRGNNRLAADMYAKLLGIAPDDVRLLALAGDNALRLGEQAKAEALLGKAVQLAPDNLQARRLLSVAQIRAGQPQKATQTLASVLSRPDVTSDVVYLAGMAQLQSGRGAEAERLFARAVKLAPDDPKIRTALALRQLARGEAAAGLSALSAVATTDKGSTADLALIGARIQRREWDAAMQAINELERKAPGLPLTHDLRARVHQANGDMAAERKSLEAAVALSATYFPAVSRLAALDISEGLLEQARYRFEALAKADPKSVPARLAIADILTQQGAKSEAVLEVLRQAQGLDPKDKAPRLAQVDFLLRTRAASLALAAAQDAVAAVPGDPDLLDALGRSQLAAGQVQQAISSLSKVVSLQPDSVRPLLRLTDLYVVRGDLELAAQQLRRALALAPDNIQVQQSLVQVSVRAGKVDVALEAAKSIQKSRPTSSLGYALEGDIHRQRKSWEAARSAYSAGLSRVPDPGYLATKLHSAHLAQGNSAEANKFVLDWLKSHPADAVLPFHLGMVALNQKDLAAAERWFREVVGKQPENARALNNLAWILAERKQQGAMPYIARALALMPIEPDFLDTRAHVSLTEGDVNGAITALRQATSIAPHRVDLRLKLGRLQVQSGDKAAARANLGPLAASAPASTDRAEAQRLLSNL